MGIALWLVPSTEENKDQIGAIMKTRQEQRQNLPSSYPEFVPHVTLASFPSSTAPSHSEIRAAIPNLRHGVPVRFASVEIGSHFFRSVYITIRPTPVLLALHEEVHEKLGAARNTPSFPHVSLCYITDQDALQGEREKFFEALQKAGYFRQNEGGQEGVSLSAGPGGWLSEYLATEVWVVNCDGPVEGWTVLDKISIVS